MNNTELLDKVEMLYNLLLSQVRGSNETALRDNAEYQDLRTFLLHDETIQPLLPRFIRTCRDLMQYWVYIRGTYAHYRERESFLREQFAPVFSELELGPLGTKQTTSEIEEVTSSPDRSLSPTQTQVSGGINASAGRDTNVGSDLVGRDKVTSNVTNITNNYLESTATSSHLGVGRK